MIKSINVICINGVKGKKPQLSLLMQKQSVDNILHTFTIKILRKLRVDFLSLIENKIHGKHHI